MINKINQNFKQGLNRKILITSFIIYFFILIWAIMFKFMTYELVSAQYKFIDLSILERFRYLFTVSIHTSALNDILNTIINLLFFLPLGMYLPLLFEKYNFARDVVLAFLLSLSFELIQGLTRTGCIDIRDIFYNVLGLVVGSLIFKLLRPITSDYIVNYIQLGIIITCLPIMIYGVLTIIFKIDMFKPFFDYKKYPYLWK